MSPNIVKRATPPTPSAAVGPDALPPIDSAEAWELFVTAAEADDRRRVDDRAANRGSLAVDGRRLVAAYSGLPETTPGFVTALGPGDPISAVWQHAGQRLRRERMSRGRTPARPRYRGTR